jgi:dTDP-4-dehydrorhamnose 3,5-epimerase
VTSTTGMRAPALPAGVRSHRLLPNLDLRGSVTEVFREEWIDEMRPIQWNAVVSGSGVLRGVHVHARHDDYIAVVRGRVAIGLSDLRRASTTARLGAVVEVHEKDPLAMAIPAGVAHGIYTFDDSVLLYGVSQYYDPDDEFVCDWREPGLGIGWPVREAIISDRDAEGRPLSAVLEEIEPWQPFAVATRPAPGS